ncbi:MAG TPA: sugar ABC transporter [Janthinobacterium sp.]|nr:sugar ABC transporter [Janthinobacterium sp.]
MRALCRRAVLFCLLLCPLLPSPSHAAHGKLDDVILVVESYNAEMPWDISYKEALQEGLGARYRLEYVQMDTKRLPKAQHAAMADKAWARYLALRPVLVVLGDDAALSLLGPRLGATTTPVVYLGINNNPRAYFDGALVKNITGVLERPVLKRNIALVKKLLPHTRSALVLFDTDITSQVVLRETFGGQRVQIIDGIRVEFRLIDNWEEWQSAVLGARAEHDVLFVGLYQALHDRAGKSVNLSDEVVRWTSEHTPIPPFCFWDWAVGANKAIGGLVLHGKEQGRAATEIALKILSGTSPSTIYPVTADRGRFLYSRKQLQRYHITLPPDLGDAVGLTD